MYKQKLKKRVLFSRAQTGVVLGVLSIATILYGGFTLYTGKAAAATNNTLNFQARLEGSAGNIAPDGNYNVQFKLYSVSSAGSALWTESYVDTNGTTAGNDFRVRVVNGYLSVSLGSQTAFPAGLNWDQDMWITMNIGGTTQTATPTYDGEMSPRLKLTGVPYAFRAGQLAQLNPANNFTSTLQLIQPTAGNQIFQIADQAAAGTYTLCVQNGAACGGSTTTLQGAYNNSATPALITTTSSTKTIAIRAGTGFDATTLFQVQNSAGAAIINVDSTNGRLGVGTASPLTRLEVGANTASDEIITVRSQGKSGIELRSDTADGTGEPGGAFVLFRQDGNTNGAMIGTTQAAGNAPDGSGFNGTSSNSLVIGTLQPDAIHLGTDRRVNMTIASGGATTFKNTTDSATAFQVQNAAGSPVLNMATDTNKLIIEQGGLNIKGLRNPAVPSLSSASTGGSLAAATYRYRLAATSNAGETQAIASNPSSVTTTGTTSVNTLSWSAVTYATGYNVYRSTDGGSTWRVNSVPSGTTSITDNGTNFSWTTVPAAGSPYLFNNHTADVQMADGASLYLSTNRNTLFKYDSDVNALVYGNYNTSGAAWIQSDSFAVQDTTGYSNNLRITNTGAATFKNRVNSTDGFKVQNSSGTSIFNVDTTNQRVGIGTATPGTALDIQGALTQRGMVAPTTSPAGQGIIYFDSTTNKFRVSQNGAAYVDLLSGSGTSITNTLLADNFDDNSLDTSKWFTFTPGGTISEINQRLQISSTLASNYSGLVSATRYNMTGQAAGTQLVSAGNQSLVGLQVFPAMIEIDNNNKLNWLVMQNRIVAQKNVAGIVTDVFSAAYSSTVHQHFRVRETGGTTFWETSDNGTSWTIRHSEANPLVVTNMNLLIMMGTFQTEATTTTVHFDNFFAGSLANGPTLQSAYDNSYSPATITTTSTTKGVTIKSGSGLNAANAFQVQNAAGATVLGVDTSTDSVLIKNKLVIQGNNSSVPNSDAPLVVAHNGTTGFLPVAGFYAPTLAAGNAVELLLGKSETANNRGQIGYFHNADGSNLNRLDFGFHSAAIVMTLRADGRVGIGNAAPGERLEVGANGLANEQIQVRSQGNASLDLQADTDDGADGRGETGTAYITFRQDGDTTGTARILGTTQAAGVSPNGQTYTDVVSNALLLGTQANDFLQLGTNKAVHMTMDNLGKIGIGTNAPAFKLDVTDAQATNYVARINNTNTTNTADGLLINLGVAAGSRTTGNYFVGFSSAGTTAGKIQGGANAVAYTTTGADYAEFFRADPADLPQAGEIVMQNSVDGRGVLKAAGKGLLNGIVSTNPGFVGNGPICREDDEDCDANYAKYNALVALSGQVPAKVNASNGAIAVGDAITSSDIRGEGAKLSGAGYIVGYAMESLSSGSGTIQVLVRPQFQAAGQNDPILAASVSLSGGMHVGTNLNVMGHSTFAGLTVTQAATFQNDVTVLGMLNVATITVNGHIITAGEAPAVSIGAAVGKSLADQPKVTIDGNDISGTITITTGETNLSTGALAKILFTKPYGKQPKVIISPVGSVSAGLQTYVEQIESEFILGTNTIPGTVMTYTYNYQVMQ